MSKISSIVKKIIGQPPQTSKDTKPAKPQSTPLIISRKQHCISRKNISPGTLKVLHRLLDAGYGAYLVGGGVRDMLLGREPKDFDVVTDARPHEIRNLFRNCRLIGRRFRLAHVYFKDEIIEVATFRSSQEESIEQERELTAEGLLHRDNVYGTLDDDVWRRDFTLNALYYNIADFTITDYTGGLEDLNHGVIRLIGNPLKRFREDPIRILRAIRFAVKLGMMIHEDTLKAIPECVLLLQHVPSARVFDEILKLFLSSYSSDAYAKMLELNVFGLLFPETQKCLEDLNTHQLCNQFLLKGFQNTDARLQEGKSINPAFMFAIILWYPLQKRYAAYIAKNIPHEEALERAMEELIQKQVKTMAIPKRLTQIMEEIWVLQAEFSNTEDKHPFRLLSNKRFRAAYDFLALRSEGETHLQEQVQWWENFQQQKERKPRSSPKNGKYSPYAKYKGPVKSEKI